MMKDAMMEGMQKTGARREEPASAAIASVSQPGAAYPSPKSAIGWKAKKEPTSEASSGVSQHGAADASSASARGWKGKEEPASEATASVSQPGAADGILEEVRS